MSKKETDTERIKRITNTPTLVPMESVPHADVLTNTTNTPKQRTSGMMNSSAALARFTYQPAFDVWRRTVERLEASGSVSLAQAESWLRPCALSLMDLPSGEVCAAALQAHSSFAAEHVRHHYARVIRFMLQRLIQKQVILFVRGPAESP
jgi:hypothetical protein